MFHRSSSCVFRNVPQVSTILSYLHQPSINILGYLEHYESLLRNQLKENARTGDHGYKYAFLERARASPFSRSHHSDNHYFLLLITTIYEYKHYISTITPIPLLYKLNTRSANKLITMPAPVFQSLFFPELYYCPCPPRKSFSPRFDVRETANAYVIEGELPGVPDKSDISVEFTDRGNLIVKGRVDRSRAAVVPPAQSQTPSSLPSQETSDKGKEKEDEEVAFTPTSSAPSSPHSLKPTVEDVPDEDDWIGVAEASTEGEAAKVEKPAEKKEQPRKKVTKREEWPKSLLSERSVGEFARSFSFPVGIDHDAVTASLQHGVLRIVVPKRISSVGKRIEVQ